MAKQLNVNLAFTADTAQAKQQLQQLQQQLNNLIAGSPAKQLGFDTEINKGIDAAARLKLALQEATNATTGKLDLGKFDQQIKKSGMTIKEYGANLAALGPKGQEAFMSLARSVSNAEIPLTRVNSKITELGVVLKNTLKWQISSSVLHGFMSAVSGAYQYAQDLNESLNNIRIVTGQSADQMDRFAEKANKAAKALNATTTEYSNAALIYYQQGLSDEDVLKRTNTTIKLANVSRESAETVSEWMTAIWNNFDNGTRSLESYADTITALGAATASSADEIAEGLEKFSAIAETVGLSYDYATAALATVTSQTRQSADVVGTAFKTLFARLEGLKLGETLEDGVTLNQYSEGLAAVGINILNANGELKDMDTILDQLGSRWDTLSKAQQVALAQTVGGIRQYNQLISLMDNWDSFQQNLTIAQTSEGALQEQADIYAESWEGAQKRVKASAEAIYSDLLDDDFFIDLLNGFSHILDTINSLIDSLGGAKGVLLAVSTLLLQMTGPKIAKGLETMALNMKYFLNPAKAQADAKAIKDQMWKTASIMSTDTGTQAGAAQGDAFKMEAKLQRYLLENASKMTETEQAIYKLRMDNVRALQEANIEHAKAVDLLDKQKEQAEINTARATKTGQSANSRLNTDQVNFGLRFKKDSTATLGKVHGATDALLQTSGLSEMKLTDAQAKLKELISVFDEIEVHIPKEIKEAKDAIDAALDAGEKGKVSDSSAKEDVRTAENSAREKARGMRDKMQDSLGKDGLKALDEEMEVKTNLAKAEKEHIKTEKDALEAGKDLLNNTKSQIKVQREWSTTVVNAAQGISSLAMGMSMVSGIINSVSDAIKEGKLSFSDFLGITISLTMGIPMVINGLKTFSAVLGITDAYQRMSIATTYSKIMADKAQRAELGKLIAAENAEKVATMLGIDADQAALLIQKLKTGATLKEALEELKLIGTKNSNIIVTGLLTAATWLQKFAQDSLNLSMSAGLAVTLVLIAALVGLVAIGAGVVAIVNAISDAYNADAIAAEKAREEAKALADAYSEVKEKYEELKQTIADYKDAQDAIDQLKQGTQEWRDAVSEANLEILNLLDKYPELAQYVQTLEGGRMIIAEQGLAKVLNQKAENVAIMANMSTMANHRANVAETKAERTDLVRNELTMKDSNVGWAVGLTATGVLAPIGAALAIADAAQTSNMEDFLDKLSQEYMDVGETAFVGLEKRLKELGVSSDNAAQEIRKLIVEQKNLAETEKIIAQQQVDNLLMAQSGFNTKNYTTGMQERAKELSDQIVAGKNISADAMHQYSNWNLAWQAPLAMAGPGSMAIGGILDATGAYIETATELGDETIKKYLEAKGLDSEQYKGINFKGDKVVWKEKGEGDTAEWVKGELSYEALAEFAKQDYLAENAAEIATAINNLMATTHTLSLSNNSYEQALASYLAEGNLSMMSPEVYNDLKGASADEITRIFNENEAVFTAAGINSAQDLVNGFDEALKTYDPVEAQQNLINKKWADFKAVIAEGAKELEVSESALKTYTEILITENKALEDNIDIAGQSAVAHFRLAKGVEKVRAAIEDNLGILEKGNANSLEYAEALGAVRDAVAETFGMNVSANFVEDNLKTIKSMTEGNIEAFKELQKSIVTDYIVNLQLEDNAKNALKKEIDSLLNEVSDLEVEGKLSLDNTDAIAALNTALENGSTTTEEIQAMFSNMNLAFPDTAITSYKKPTRTTTITENSIWDESTGKTTNTRTKSTVTSEVEIPWIGNNPPKFKMKADGFGGTTYEFDEEGNAIQEAGHGKSDAIGGITKTAEVSSQNLKDMLSYDSDAKGETKEARKARIKSLNDEVERYHEIEEVIDDLSKEMDKLSKAKDRAFGKDKVAIMQQELEVLDAQIAAQDVIIAKAKAYMELDKQNLKNLRSDIQIDEETGNILNFSKIQADYLQRLGSMSTEDAGYETLENEYQLFMDYVAKYEETYDKFEQEVENKADQVAERLDKQLEQLDYNIEVNVEVNERSLKILERQLKRLNDDAFDSAERIALMSQKIDTEFSNIDFYKKGIREILGDKADDYFKGDASTLEGLSTEEVEKLKKYTDAIMDSEDAILELRENIESQVMTTFDAWHEKIEKNGRAFEHATSMVESYKNIIDIVGKSRLGIDDAILQDLEETSVRAAQGSMANSKAQMDTTKKALEEAQVQLEKAKERGNQDDIDMWEESVETLNETLQADTEAFMSSWEEALSAAAEAFTAQMDRAFEGLEDNLAGAFKSFEELNTAMEKQETVSNRFLDAGKKQYELSKLNRTVIQDLNKTDNAKAQKALLDFQKEIEAYQESGAEMSQRDLEALQKKYDLKVAEIALEEAQNAKSQVRLQRDAQGNFGYVYTANETEIANAQQNYEDQLEANRQLAIDQNKELTESIVANRQAMVEALKEIRKEDYKDDAAYQKALEDTTKFYQEQEAYLIGETQKVIERSQYIYENDYQSYKGWSNEKLLNSSQTWNQLENSQQAAYGNMGENTSGWVVSETNAMKQLGIDVFNAITGGEDGKVGTIGMQKALGDAEAGTGFFGESKKAAETWQQSIDEIMRLAGIDISDISKDADAGLGVNGAQKSFVDFKTAVLNSLYGVGGTKTSPKDGSVNGAINAATGEISELETQASTSFTNVGNKVSNWQKEYSPKIDQATKDTDALNKSLQTLLDKQKPDIEVTVKDDPASTKLKNLIEQLEEIVDKEITVKVNYEEYNTDKLNNPPINNDTLPPEEDDKTTTTIQAVGYRKSGGQAVKINDVWYSAAQLGLFNAVEGQTIKKSILGGQTDIEDAFTAYNVSSAEVYLAQDHLLDKKGGQSFYTADHYLNQYDKITNIALAGMKNSNPYYAVTIEQEDGTVKTVYMNEELLDKHTNYKAYDTGGYTGAWGPEGRLAMLHQKEIVLNAHDTENFLAAIGIVRDISDQIEKNAIAMQYQNQLNTYRAVVDSTGQTMQQEVTIHAEFPNATNHSEIEEAFRNLTTLASQYTNRKI